MVYPISSSTFPTVSIISNFNYAHDYQFVACLDHDMLTCHLKSWPKVKLGRPFDLIRPLGYKIPVFLVQQMSILPAILPAY